MAMPRRCRAPGCREAVNTLVRAPRREETFQHTLSIKRDTAHIAHKVLEKRAFLLVESASICFVFCYSKKRVFHRARGLWGRR